MSKIGARRQRHDQLGADRGWRAGRSPDWLKSTRGEGPERAIGGFGAALLGDRWVAAMRLAGRERAAP
jgi:hypothetical protein